MGGRRWHKVVGYVPSRLERCVAELRIPDRILHKRGPFTLSWGCLLQIGALITIDHHSTSILPKLRATIFYSGAWAALAVASRRIRIKTSSISFGGIKVRLSAALRERIWSISGADKNILLHLIVSRFQSIPILPKLLNPSEYSILIARECQIDEGQRLESSREAHVRALIINKKSGSGLLVSS